MWFQVMLGVRKYLLGVVVLTVKLVGRLLKDFVGAVNWGMMGEGGTLTKLSAI